MKTSSLRLMPILLLVFGSTAMAGEDSRLKEVIAGDHRTADAKARDQYRHPQETLEFFGISEEMTVVEIYPGGGWYTQILAPYLKDKGQLIAAVYDRDPKTQKSWMEKYNKEFTDAYVGKPELYGDIKVVDLAPPHRVELAPAGSVDAILDFRNAHNWLPWGADEVAKGYSDALKKGGVLGLIAHRMDASKPYDPENGYVHQQTIVDLMEKNGFELAASSEVNSNPKDTKDHSEGVWTLPPSLALGEEKSEQYLAIGESDRMTLKFVKR